MSFGLGEEGLSLLTVFLILIPMSLYIMGLMEGKKGYYFFLFGILFHILSIFQRGLVVGTIPLTEKHDNISFMAFAMALVYWYFYRKKGMKELGMTTLPLISIFMFVSLTYKPINTISPFLRSPWFYLHIFFYFISYGFFGISACIGLQGLTTIFSSNRKTGTACSDHPALSRDYQQETPPNTAMPYEQLQYWGAVHGWIVYSVALVAGSIWFFMAYGTYWLWTSKELWTTLTWFYYGLYLHARLIRSMRGRPAAVLGCLGFAVALFTYFGVGTVIPSPPTQF